MVRESSVGVLATVLGSSLLLGPAGEAAPPQVTYAAPAGCPDRDRFLAAVQGYVGRALTEPVTIAVEIAEAEPFALTLRFAVGEGPQVEQSLEDPDCAVVVEAAALKVAFAIDPDATTKALAESEPQPVPAPDPVPDPDPEPVPVPAPVPVPVPDPEPVPDPAPPEQSCHPGPSALQTGNLAPRCAALGLRVGVQVGPLPSVGPGLGGHVAALWPRLRLELGAAHWFSRPASIAAGGGAIRLTQVDAAVCGRLGVKTVEFPLCAGFELGSFYGRGTGIDDPNEERLLWAAALVHGRVAWSPLRRFAVFLQPGLVVPFAQYRFRINGDELVHESAPAAFRGFLGVELRLP